MNRDTVAMIRTALKAGERVPVDMFVRFCARRFADLRSKGMMQWTDDQYRLFAHSTAQMGSDYDLIRLKPEQIDEKTHPLGSQYVFQLAVLCGDRDNKVRITSVDIVAGQVRVNFVPIESREPRAQNDTTPAREYASKCSEFVESNEITYRTLIEIVQNRIDRQDRDGEFIDCMNFVMNGLWDHNPTFQRLFSTNVETSAFRAAVGDSSWSPLQIKGAVDFVNDTFEAMIKNHVGRRVYEKDNNPNRINVKSKVVLVNNRRMFRLFTNDTYVFLRYEHDEIRYRL